MLQRTHEPSHRPSLERCRGRSRPALMPTIKICGVRTPEALEAALGAGADMVGFVHFPASPRHLTLDEGQALSALARGRALRVLLLVDPDPALVAAAVAAFDPDLIQLHGAETPAEAASVRERTGRAVMKSVGIGAAADLARIAAYKGAADRILLDAKPAPDASRPGGNGLAFDWALLAELPADPGLPTMLSGGLSPDNVAEAIARTAVAGVDVSSGVETRPGEKDAAKIEAFVRAARAAFAARESGPEVRRVA